MSALKDRMLAPKVPDLTQPSLESLAYILRHKKLWPTGFEWNYGCFDTCAMGLCRLIWGRAHDVRGLIWHSGVDFHASPYDQTPEHVADRIDDHLAKLQN